jgi:hypothetical protein
MGKSAVRRFYNNQKRHGSSMLSLIEEMQKLNIPSPPHTEKTSFLAMLPDSASQI